MVSKELSTQLTVFGLQNIRRKGTSSEFGRVVLLRNGGVPDLLFGCDLQYPRLPSGPNTLSRMRLANLRRGAGPFYFVLFI
jgi:hypothetical protein